METLIKRPRLRILTQSDWETRVAGLYSLATMSQCTSDELNNLRRDRLWSELNRTHGKDGAKQVAVYDVHMHGFVAGMDRVYNHMLYRHHLEYCYLVDGVLYSTHKESTHRLTDEFYERGEGRILGQSFSGHYWRGTDKLFWGSKT